MEIQDTVPRVVCSPLVLYLPSSSPGKPCSGNTSGYIIPSVKLKVDSDIKTLRSSSNNRRERQRDYSGIALTTRTEADNQRHNE